MCRAEDCIEIFRAHFGRDPKYISINCECTIKTNMRKGYRRRTNAYRKQKQASDQHNYDT
jgi:hypothetical protein